MSRHLARGAAWLLFALATPTSMQAQETVLVEADSSIVYLANSSDPGLGFEWTERIYANSWSTGTYAVGYGAGPLISTTVPTGTSSVYTRAEFDIVDITLVETLSLGADFDDGYIAWVNGVEVYRSPQMPDVATLPTPAWDTVPESHESSNGLPPNYGDPVNISALAIPELVNGTNVLAVGIWNRFNTSSDLALVPQLIMNVPPPAPRGPYLQLGTPDSIVVRWRTDILEDSRVRYGPDPGSLTSVVDDPFAEFDHEVKLSGLAADTEYFYSVGNTAGTVFAGGDADHFFRTAPLLGTRRPIRVWAIGDSGTADANADDVFSAYEDYSIGTHTDLWLMLGDNAYPNGTDDEYQNAVFETYPGLLRRSVLWPTLGNHDAVSASTVNLTGPYYEIFTLVDTTEVDGIASGTEAYYSFDFGNIHFVCLNSQELSIQTDMLTWLQADLLNTSQDWVIAFWHHPPYSKGSHDSDDVADSGGRLFAAREEFLPLLEAEGVDLVLTGHSHSYERSFLLDGHYGDSTEIVLNPALKLDAGDGRIGGDGAYQKATPGPASHEGAVYVVAGSAGKLSGGTLDHPAMAVSWNVLGSVVLDVNGDRMDLTFLDHTMLVQDTFSLVKDTGVPPVADFSASTIAGPAPLGVDFVDLSTTNTATWSWDLDGDAIIDSTVPQPSHTYASPGFYTVSLTAGNNSGSDTESKAAHICVSEGIPDAVSGMSAGTGGPTFSWNVTPAADHYDVVKGDLGLLVSSGGDFGTALQTCLEDDGTDEEVSDFAVPAPGGAFFYLVRGLSLCDEEGTYDSGGTAQLGPRDLLISASAQNCP